MYYNSIVEFIFCLLIKLTLLLEGMFLHLTTIPSFYFVIFLNTKIKLQNICCSTVQSNTQCCIKFYSEQNSTKNAKLDITFSQMCFCAGTELMNQRPAVTGLVRSDAV